MRFSIITKTILERDQLKFVEKLREKRNYLFQI
jgi:hypothetical protein